MLETIYILVAVSLSPAALQRVERADPREFRTEAACLREIVWGYPVGVFGVLDQRVYACRRVNRERLR